jgi:hypothetical protein
MITESSATIGALALFLADAPELTAQRRSVEEIAATVKTFDLTPRLTAMGLWPREAGR